MKNKHQAVKSNFTQIKWRRSFGLSEAIMFIVGIGTGILAMLFFI